MSLKRNTSIVEARIAILLKKNDFTCGLVEVRLTYADKMFLSSIWGGHHVGRYTWGQAPRTLDIKIKKGGDFSLKFSS